MNTSIFAAVELALIKALLTELPPRVEVTTLSPAAAAKFKARLAQTGWVNVTLLRVAADAAMRNAPARLAPAGTIQPRAAFDLSYLISAYAGVDATANGGAPHLLECVVRALIRQPIQTVSIADAAGTTTDAQITLQVQDLTFDQMNGLWTALGTELQPAIVCLARPVMVG